MIDVIVWLFLFVMFISGLSRGILRQLWAVGVLALSTYLSGSLYLSFVGLIGRYVHDDATSKLASFALVFIVISAVLNSAADVVIIGNRKQRRQASSPGDRLAAAVLGVIEGIGVIQVGAALFITYPVWGWDGWIKASSLIHTFFQQWPLMMPLLPPEFQAVLEIFK